MNYQGKRDAIGIVDGKIKLWHFWKKKGVWEFSYKFELDHKNNERLKDALDETTTRLLQLKKQKQN